MKALLLGANKTQPLHVFYAKILEALNRQPKERGLIRFPDVFLALSWFHFAKSEAWLLLRELVELGMITIVPYNGIKIKKEKGKNER